MGRAIMHVDLNYFFVRCEEIKNPQLENKPVMIGGLGRAGIVSTCSYKAREYGVHSGMPSYLALKKCPHIIVLPGDYHFYSLMSAEFFAFAKKYTHKIEIASIDECYMDVTELVKRTKEPLKIFDSFQKNLFKKTGLKCSIGVASTKFLAKMGSDLKKPMGITVIRKKEIGDKLYSLPIENFYGIGKKTAPRLRSENIYTIGDMANLLFNNYERAQKVFGTSCDYLISCLNGSSSDEIYLGEDDPKSIGHSTTLSEDTNDIDLISSVIKLLSNQVSERARSAGMVGKTIQLTLKDTEFANHNRSKTLSNYTNDEKVIAKAACELLLKISLSGLYRLVGVTLQGLRSESTSYEQLTLFNSEEIAKNDTVGNLISKINRKFNKNVVFKASKIKDIKND